MPQKLPTTARPNGELDLDALAIAAGEAWAESCASQLRDQRRAVTGGWPGTMTEARSWVLATIGGRREVSVDQLRTLSRAAYGAAKKIWQDVAGRDVEP